MHVDFPAINTKCTPYIRVNACYWPTLNACSDVPLTLTAYNCKNVRALNSADVPLDSST